MGGLTLRQQFAEHRKDMSCAGCHAFLDPMGFAMENFDAIGKWRDKDNKLPIDASGMWVRGQTFNDMTGLRQILASELKQDFLRCLTEHLLTFALGRGVEYYDRPAVTQILKDLDSAGGGFQSLILEVCQSAPFQRVRLPD